MASAVLCNREVLTVVITVDTNAVRTGFGCGHGRRAGTDEWVQDLAARWTQEVNQPTHQGDRFDRRMLVRPASGEPGVALGPRRTSAIEEPRRPAPVPWTVIGNDGPRRTRDSAAAATRSCWVHVAPGLQPSGLGIEGRHRATGDTGLGAGGLVSQQSVRRIAVPNPGVGEMEEASAMCGVGLVDGVVEWGTGQENRGRRRLQGNSDVVVGVESTGVRPRPTLAVKPHELVDHIEATEAHRHGKEIDGGRVAKRGNIRSGPKDAMSCSPNRRAGQLSVPPLRCEPAGRRRQRAATSQPTAQDLLGPTPPGQPVGRVGDDRVHALAFEATEHSLSVTAVKVKLSHMLLEPSERLIMTMKIQELCGSHLATVRTTRDRR